MSENITGIYNLNSEKRINLKSDSIIFYKKDNMRFNMQMNITRGCNFFTKASL